MLSPKLKIFQVIIISLVTFFVLISMGIYGKQLTYYFELVTSAEREVINDDYKSYQMSMKSAIAFNTVLLVFLPFYVAGTWLTESKGCSHKVVQAIYVAIWLGRFISGIVYLEGNKKWREIKEFEHDTFEAKPEICEELVMIRKCAYVDSYIQTIDYETFFMIFFSIAGLALIPIMYLINRDKRTYSYEDQQKASNDMELQSEKPMY